MVGPFQEATFQLQPSTVCDKPSYSWKFLRDKNFEVFTDFDLAISSKIKPQKIVGTSVKVLVP